MTDWRLEIPLQRRKVMRRWFWLIAFVTFGVLVVGGATRLTHSGLSMVQWQPILGVVPPLSDADWQHRFQQYQQFPEFQKMRQNMTLHEFKYIFFWEYLHRLLARSIGIVFLIPFAFFLMRGWMTKPLIKRSTALFGLGMMQGLMGWLMVASGLVDRPSVSHYRLAAHLSLAFIIFGYAIWLARELTLDFNEQRVAPKYLKGGLITVGALLCLQIVYGAFVAGLHAGFFANTFPLMDGQLFPDRWMVLRPAWTNFTGNPVMVQWLHRLIGTVFGVAVLMFSLHMVVRESDREIKRYALTLLGAVLIQYALGVLTLINAVPVPLGVTHQAMAMIVFGIWVVWLHHTRRTFA